MTGAGSNDDTARGRRWPLVVAIALGAFVVLVAAVIVFVVSVDLGRFKSTIVDIVRDETGREFRIDGPLSIDVGRRIRVRAEGIVLGNAEWANGEDMLSVGGVDVTVATMSLLSGPPRVENLELSDVTARLQRSEDGRANWVLVEADEIQDEPRDGPTVTVEAVDARNIDVTIDVPSMAEPASVRISSLAHAIDGDQLRTSVSGSVNGQPLALSGNVGPRSHIWTRQPVDVDVEGSVGELTLTAQANIDDLQNPSRPEIAIDFSGPGVDYLFDMLNLQPVTSGPLDVSVSVARGDEQVTLDARGTFGEFRFEAAGKTATLATLADLDLRFEAAGPDLAHVGRLAGIARLPAQPFDVAGRVATSASNIVFDDVSLTSGTARLALDGTVALAWPFEGEELTLTLEGEDIAEFRQALGLPGVLSGPFSFTGNLLPDEGDYERIRVAGSVGEISENATLYLSDSKTLDGSRVEFEIAGPDAGVPARAAGIEELPALPFRIAGTAAYNVETVALDTLSASLGDIAAEMSGRIDTRFPGSSTRLDVIVTAPDAGNALAPFDISAPNETARIEAELSVTGDTLTLSDIRAELGNDTLSGSISADITSPASALEFDLAAAVREVGRLVPAEAGFRPAALPLDARLAGSLRDDRITLRNISATFGDAKLAVSGTIDRPPGLDATSLEMRLDVPDLSTIGSRDGAPLPALPLTIGGKLAGAPDAVTGTDLEIVAGDSRMRADFTYRDTGSDGDVPFVQLDIASRRIDLRPFASDEENPQDTDKEQPRRERLIPDVAFPVGQLERLDANVSLRVDELQTTSLRHRDLRIRGSLDSGALEISEIRVHGPRGRFQGSLEYVPAGDDYALTTNLAVDELRIGPVGEDLNARPAAELRIDVSARGTDLRGIFATLDGSAILDSGPGIIPNSRNWLTDLFVGDFVTQLIDTVNPFAKEEKNGSVSCAAGVFDIDDGVVSGKPMLIVQMKRITLSVAGTVNLATEAIDIGISTKQRKGLGISLSQVINPYTRISGTMASPRLGLDEKGAIVQGGAAVATGGLSVLAKGLTDRFLSNDDPCGTLLADYRDKEDAGEAAQ